MRCLKSIRDGVQLVTPQHTAGDIRGFRTALRTLGRWGCYADGELTDVGALLLETLEAKHAA